MSSRELINKYWTTKVNFLVLKQGHVCYVNGNFNLLIHGKTIQRKGHSFKSVMTVSEVQGSLENVKMQKVDRSKYYKIVKKLLENEDR